MALSDQDRAAMRRLREVATGVDPGTVAAIERVLALAGLEPEEPAEGTFWYDPEEHDVWIRDDKSAYDSNDLSRWWTTGSGEKFSWIQVWGLAPKLVELVRADEVDAKKRQWLLVELHGAWEAWHHNACGRSKPLSLCGYHECAHRWKTLLDLGYLKEWEVE
jgi:hypothetical protein